MRRLGVIGGISWHSTAKYYEQLNTGVQERLGGHHSADLLIHSLDFAEVESLQRMGDWSALEKLMVGSARALVASGAEALLIGANTMHKTAEALSIFAQPVLHIADAIASAAQARGVRRLGLLGTRFTTSERFLADALEHHALDVVVPEEKDRFDIDAIIFNELVHGSLSASSSARGLQVIEALGREGCEGVALACTELGIPRWHKQTAIPLIDSQQAHVELALSWMLASSTETRGR